MGLLLGGIDSNAMDGSARQTIDQLAALTRETSHMFNSILDLSKLEIGTFAAISVPVDVTELFRRIELEFAQRANSARARLSVSLPPSDTFVLGDAEAIYRILSNLLVNALDYGRDGTITVGTAPVEDGAVAIFVADQGPGLAVSPPPTASKANEQTVRHYGLGLSICFALTKAMNTDLVHRPLDEGGTEFRFQLPKTAVPGEITPSPIATPANGLNGRHLILLEDNANVHSATKGLLERLGSRVTACRSIHDAQEKIAEQTAPFLFVTDYDLGRGNTAETLISETLEHAKHLQAIIITTASPAHRLAEWIEIATLHLVSNFSELDPAQVSRRLKDESDELTRIAADPARALNAQPSTEGGKRVRDSLLAGCKLAGLDLETRTGAASIGDLAKRWLGVKVRATDCFTIGVEVLFENVADCLRELAAWTFDQKHFPSNGLLELNNGEKWPAIEFARAFIEIVHDETRRRIVDPSFRAERYLSELIKKSDRALLDGLRHERQAYERHGDFGLGGDDASTVVSMWATFLD